MSSWLTLARLFAALNMGLLVALSSVWVRNYRQHGAKHTLGLLVVGAFLLVENALWLFLYVFHPGFVAWFTETTTDVQVGVMLLCGLEFVALVALVRLTWL